MNEKKFEDLTDEEVKNLKIEFVPGCFDEFDGTQEELDEMIAFINDIFKDPAKLKEMSRPLTEEEFDQLPESAQAKLASVFLDEEEQKLVPEEFKRKLQ